MLSKTLTVLTFATLLASSTNVLAAEDDELSSEIELLPAYSAPGAIVELPVVEEYVMIEAEQEQPEINGPQEYHLTKQSGVFNGPSGKETYYNLNMSGVVKVMRNMGYMEDEYPYWEREDGVKMIGPYVMVAADFDIRPRGSVVETSLGTGLVCDTGGFASGKVTTTLDIAVNW